MKVWPDTCGRRRHLLLLCLFVLEAAADCPLPKGTETIVLSNEALLMNEFPEGTTVRLECGHGYTTESGSGVISCIGGAWSELDLTCKKKDCGSPPPTPNMNYDLSPGTLFGARIRVTCDKGYEIFGSSYKQCYANGWRGKAMCELVTCETPANPDNGKRISDSEEKPQSYGGVIKFVCNEGYTLVGNDSITCTETGDYDSPPPQCKDMTTEDRTTKKGIAPTPTSPPQVVSNSTSSVATITAHRIKATNATSAVPPSSGQDKLGGALNTNSDFDKLGGALNTNSDFGYIPVIVSVISVLLVVSVVVLVFHRFNLRRKGSYDTREDLKPELLQFQNV